MKHERESTIFEYIPMPSKEYEIPLIVQSNDLSSLELWLFRQKTLKKSRNANPQPRREIIQNQFGQVTRRIPVAGDRLTRLDIGHAEPGRGTIGEVNEGDCVNLFTGAFFVDHEHVCEASFRCAFGESLEGEVCSAARTEGGTGKDVEEVCCKDVGWAGERRVMGGRDEEFGGCAGVGEEGCEFIRGKVCLEVRIVGVGDDCFIILSLIF